MVRPCNPRSEGLHRWLWVIVHDHRVKPLEGGDSVRSTGKYGADAAAVVPYPHLSLDFRKNSPDLPSASSAPRLRAASLFSLILL